MSDFTDYMEDKISAWYSNVGSFPTEPASMYVGLHTSDPGDQPDGQTEVTASDYTRVEFSDWQQATAGTTLDGFLNVSDIEFGVADTDWGTITHVTLWDGSADTDNPLAVTELNSSVTVNTDNFVRFQAGQLNFQVS